MKGHFGERLKELRKAVGITQSELAEKLNIHLQTVSKWERSLSEPDISILGNIADVLDVSLEKLLLLPEGTETYVGSFSVSDFGKAISAMRKSKEDSQEEFAKKIGVSSDAVSKWERGVICPGIDELVKLSRLADVPVSKLYYAISEEDRTENVVKAKRRKKLSFVWLSVATIACITVILTAFFLSRKTELPQPLNEKFFTVVVDGKDYTVSEHDWFIPQTPIRDGYDFTGYIDEEGNTAFFPSKITENAQYTAVFVPHEYHIDYWLNGGYFTENVNNSFTIESDKITLPVPKKDGALFEGWHMAPDYSDARIDNIVCELNDIELYAKWSDVSYTIRYELNSGVLGGTNPTSVTADNAVVLQDPVRKGYNFLGWYDTPSGGIQYTEVGGKDAKNLTLYALWQEYVGYYTVNYQLNGGKLLADNPASIGAGEVYSLNSAEKAGYDFVGWNDRADGKGNYYSDLYGVSKDMWLYAIFTPKTYVVRYELDDGTYCEGVNPNRIKFGESVILKPVTKYGHTFEGWFDGESGEKVEQIDTENILRIHTLYARFEENNYIITLHAGNGFFEVNGNRVQTHSFTLKFGEKLTLPSAVLAGYDFLGWQDETGKIFEKIDEINIENLSLTAKFRSSSLTYRITYILNEGQFVTPYDEIISAGQKILLAEPEREGYIFLGWNDESDGSGEYYFVTDPGWEMDITLYAIWQEIIINGSAAYFKYEKGASAVTITNYDGPYGENMVLEIPAYIDGLPVVCVKDLTVIRKEIGDYRYLTFKSIKIPNTVRTLGEDAFRGITVKEEIVIPSGVESIESGCFYGNKNRIRFENGSKLKTIGMNAFYNVSLKEVLILPDCIETIEEGAFREAILSGGIILPKNLRRIERQGLAVSLDHFETNIFLPDSVEYVESEAFFTINPTQNKVNVYMRRSKAETLQFEKDWDYGANVHYESGTYNVTLDDGNGMQTFTGGAVVLPEPEKTGFWFLGWQDEDGTVYREGCFIPQKDCNLKVLYELKQAGDGRSAQTPVVLECGVEYHILLSPNIDYITSYFYFIPNVQSGQRIKIVYKVGSPEDIDSQPTLDKIFSDRQYSIENERDIYEDGIIYRIHNRAATDFYQLTVKVELA